MDWIWKSLVEENSKGVKLDQLTKLMSIIGVTRELARDKKRTAERIEKEKVIGGMRDSLKAKKLVKKEKKALSKTKKKVTKAKKAIKKAKKAVKKVKKSAKKIKKKKAVKKVKKP